MTIVPLDGTEPVHCLLLKHPRILQTKHTVSHIQCRYDFWQRLNNRCTHKGIRLHTDGFDKGVAESIDPRMEDLWGMYRNRLETCGSVVCSI